MQPLEAARLFAEALSNQSNLTSQQHKQVDSIGHSLKVASDLLADLSEIARIESGNVKPQCEPFALSELIDGLANEFLASADQVSVDFRIVNTKVWVYSDKQLLRRMIKIYWPMPFAMLARQGATWYQASRQSAANSGHR